MITLSGAHSITFSAASCVHLIAVSNLLYKPNDDINQMIKDNIYQMIAFTD
jgi:hypothetical protein